MGEGEEDGTATESLTLAGLATAPCWDLPSSAPSDLSQTLHLTTILRGQIDSSQESSAIRNEVDYRLAVAMLAGQMSPYEFAHCTEGTSGAMLFIKDSRSKHTRNLWA